MAVLNSEIDYFTQEHEMIRRAVKDFMKKEVVPFIEEWEEQGEFPIGITGFFPLAGEPPR